MHTNHKFYRWDRWYDTSPSFVLVRWLLASAQASAMSAADVGKLQAGAMAEYEATSSARLSTLQASMLSLSTELVRARKALHT